MKKQTPQLLLEVHALRAKGLGKKTIAKMVGITKTAVDFWLNPDKAAKNKNLAKKRKCEFPWVCWRTYVKSAAKKRAKEKGLEFSLATEDIEDAMPHDLICPALGVKLTLGKPYVSNTSATIDRKDNTKGYVKSNIQILSYQANTMKRDATPDELLKFANWIQETFRKADNG